MPLHLVLTTQALKILRVLAKFSAVAVAVIVEYVPMEEKYAVVNATIHVYSPNVRRLFVRYTELYRLTF